MVDEKKPEEVKAEGDKKKIRIKECTKAVNKVLDEFGCTLSCYIVLTGKGNTPVVQVISK